jgi:hypothetical protein
MDVSAKKEITLDYSRYKAEQASARTQGYNSATACLIKVLKDIESGNMIDAHLIIEEHFEANKDELIKLLKIQVP